MINITEEKYKCLLNEAHTNIKVDGVYFNTITNAYIASRSMYSREKLLIANMSVEEAIRYSKKMDTVLNWGKIKYRTLVELLLKKFENNKDQKDVLMSTGNEMLTTNRKNDGNLGQALMEVRGLLRGEEK